MDAAMIMGMIITLQIIGIQIMTMDHNTLKFTSISILRHICMTKILPPLDLHRYNVENSAEKRAYLYPHPQQISGVILKNDVRKVAEAIECMSLSSIRWVDLYDTVYVLSDEAYEKYLMFKDEALKKDLFDVCQTPRITRFYDAIEISRALAMKYRLKRLGINDGRNYGSGQTIDHIMRLMQKMSEDGLLVMTSPSGEETYVRSLNKTELKKWIRSHMMLIEQYRFLWSNRKG